MAYYTLYIYVHMIYIYKYIYIHIYTIYPGQCTFLHPGRSSVRGNSRCDGLVCREKKTDGRGEMGQITMVFDTEIEENYHLPR